MDSCEPRTSGISMELIIIRFLHPQDSILKRRLAETSRDSSLRTVVRSRSQELSNVLSDLQLPCDLLLATGSSNQ